MMCGIVSYFGQFDGTLKVLEALQLLEYRAPDSVGLAVIDERGQMAVRREVGSPRRLIPRLARDPLFVPADSGPDRVADLLTRQGMALQPLDLQVYSPREGFDIHDLYTSPGLKVGVGVRGGLRPTALSAPPPDLSRRMQEALGEVVGDPFPDFDPDPVRHAFRLIASQVASRVPLDPALQASLDAALMDRVPPGAYGDWSQAWEQELAANTPGQAFATAVRHFQETFPGLAPHLEEEDWERVGGLTARALAHIVVGHGRWAMVGAVTEANAHPLTDRSRSRVMCENGSHNAMRMLRMRTQQEAWWRGRGVPLGEHVHRSENTTEVIAYEWERAFHQALEGDLDPASADFRARLDSNGIHDPEERALRLALWRVRKGNAHACGAYSRRRPDSLFISSHHKPIAIVTRTIQPSAGPTRREVLVASDVNAALMMWPGEDVDEAADRLEKLRREHEREGLSETRYQRRRQEILDRFSVEVVFLDTDLFGGRKLFARISHRIRAGAVLPEIQVTRYDGTPVPVAPQKLQIDPSMAGKRGFPSYTESHIAEIPGVLRGLAKAYVHRGRVNLERPRQISQAGLPGLDIELLQGRFGESLSQLRRILLVGEGSSWRDAQAAAPMFRELLPDAIVTAYRPVELLNLGEAVDRERDLAVEISWSGTTDSLLKVDHWLSEMDVLRLSVTGRPQSDLGRRTAGSAGVLNVRSGVEVSVATVKGYQAILMSLDLLALFLASLHTGESSTPALSRLLDELAYVLPRHVQNMIADPKRRERIRQLAGRCRDFNKVAVVGDSPVDLEAELKIEELAQIVARAFDFHDASLRPLMERSALMDEDRHRTLFIINATHHHAHQKAGPIINYLQELGVFGLVHTTPNEDVRAWQSRRGIEVFVSPQVHPLLQPLIDAPFFFDLAVALAYARGLSPDEIDRPRNLAKSVTTTGAERRATVIARQELRNPSLADFSAGLRGETAWKPLKPGSMRDAYRSTTELRGALQVISEPLPAHLQLDGAEHLVVFADTEATENGAAGARAAWEGLLGMDLTVYRRFVKNAHTARPNTTVLRIVRSGAVLSVGEERTIALPDDLSPLQLELLTCVYLTGVAIRLARLRGADTRGWEAALTRLPLIVAEILSDRELATRVCESLKPYVSSGYDKLQIIGGGQDFTSAVSLARSIRSRGFMAEALYTDSAWHGPLATVGGPDADHDALITILATDPLFQAAALVDTQVYRTRHAQVLLVVPEGNREAPAVQGVSPSQILAVPAVPRPFLTVVGATLGRIIARTMDALWDDRSC
jgi:glucosamine 6-phosphate synthetase-like amidotransferase/phosphosugar isomerase protein